MRIYDLLKKQTNKGKHKQQQSRGADNKHFVQNAIVIMIKNESERHSNSFQRLINIYLHSNTDPPRSLQ